MNRQKIVVLISSALLNLFVALFVSIGFIEFGGILAVVTWIVIVAVSIVSIVMVFKSKVRLKGLLAAVIISTICINIQFTGLGIIRGGTRTVYYEYHDGSNYHVLYEVNPGAMGHISYLQKSYTVVSDNIWLRIMLVKDEKHFRYLDGFGGFE